jgi:CrcB protein
MTWTRLLVVCLGGAVGTGVRYLVAIGAARWPGSAFPYGTLAVNVVGCFLIGLIQEMGAAALLLPDTTRLFLTTGIMGGLTTYSTFSYETMRLAEEGAWLQAVANVVGTTGLCLLSCALGIAAGRIGLGAGRGI